MAKQSAKRTRSTKTTTTVPEGTVKASTKAGRLDHAPRVLMAKAPALPEMKAGVKVDAEYLGKLIVAINKNCKAVDGMPGVSALTVGGSTVLVLDHNTTRTTAKGNKAVGSPSRAFSLFPTFGKAKAWCGHLVAMESTKAQ